MIVCASNIFRTHKRFSRFLFPSLLMCKTFQPPKTFHLFFFVFFSHQRQKIIRTPEEIAQKLMFFFASPHTLELRATRKIYGERFGEKVKSWRNLSNDLYWILLRHILSRNCAGALFSQLIHHTVCVTITHRLFPSSTTEKLHFSDIFSMNFPTKITTQMITCTGRISMKIVRIFLLFIGLNFSFF